MGVIHRREIERYLKGLFGAEVQLEAVSRLGETAGAPATTKGYGYGEPLRLTVRRAGRRQDLVLETVRPGPFGHEHLADRAQSLIWDHVAFNHLPGHVRSVDVGGFLAGGRIVSLGRLRECFIVMEYAPGRGYNEDLERILRTGRIGAGDLARAEALAGYLGSIHRRRKRAPNLYRRRLRDLLGHGECIMGLTDSYPLPFGFITADLLEQIEQRCNAWRWRLHDRAARLCQVHGDFHPWNVLFRRGHDFTVLDRARGEWGDPADDLTSMSINYLFFSLQRYGRLQGPFERLFRAFWDRYLGDMGTAVLDGAAPFFAFRGLVVASPVWYPRLPLPVRRKIFNFILNVLEQERFDPVRVNTLLEAP